MPLLAGLELEGLSTRELWGALDEETRRQAAESLYKHKGAGETGCREADQAIAAALRFREVAVRRLPVERRIAYLLSRVHPNDSLTSTLLLALHLDRRVPLLERFLGALEIPQKEGLIDPEFEIEPPPPERLDPLLGELFEEFPADHVSLYLACLLAMDPNVWAGLVEPIRQRFSD